MIKCEFENGNKASLRHAVTDLIVVKDSKILLVKRAAGLLDGGKWGLPAGYMERDETILDCARRELMEETGWEAGELTLLAIDDKLVRPGDDRQNIIFLFFCTVTKRTGEPDNESDDVQWFPLDKLPPAEQLAFDYANAIKLYRRYEKEKFPVPIFNN
jgi:ADP-ribose pyrophosphatase YjhB (NUDIX family)